MPLSEHEQRLLEQMERALYAEDPKFASSLRSAGPRPGRRRKAVVGGLAARAGVGVGLTPRMTASAHAHHTSAGSSPSVAASKPSKRSTTSCAAPVSTTDALTCVGVCVCRVA